MANTPKGCLRKNPESSIRQQRPPYLEVWLQKMLQSLKPGSAQTQSNKSEIVGEENWNMVNPQSEMEELSVTGIPVIPGFERLRQSD